MSVELSNKDVRGIIRRRKGVFTSIFLVIFLVCTGIAFYLPPIYRSQSTILIENQVIPEDYVKSTITTYINERLYMLQQEILSRGQLLKIIKKHHLYTNIDDPSEKVKRMRKDININPIDTSVMDQRTGRAKTVTVAFTLSYDGRDPAAVLNVTNELSNFFVERDLQTREKLSSSTTDFFQIELDNLKKKINAYDSKISAFRAKHINELPGSSAAKLQNIAYLNQQLQDIDSRMRTLMDKKIYLQAQIANVNPMAPIVSDNGKVTKSPIERLKYLRLKLIELEATLSPRHPDVIATKREIRKLEQKVGRPNIAVEKIRLLKQIKDELAAKESKLGPDHPDVIKLKKEVRLLTNQVDKLKTGNTMPEDYSNEVPDNPAYMNLKAQIIAANAELGSLKEERKSKEQQLKDDQSRLEMIPMVEKEYNQLTLNFEGAKQKYNEIQNKLFSAQISRQMDVSKRGERFKIADPPRLPEQPYKPNRIAIILFGLVLGLFAGLSVAALQEGRDKSVKSSDEIESIFGMPVIAKVSYFESERQRKTKRLKRLKEVSAIILLVVCGFILINRYIVPMNTVWTTFKSRLIELGVPLDK